MFMSKKHKKNRDSQPIELSLFLCLYRYWFYTLDLSNSFTNCSFSILM